MLDAAPGDLADVDQAVDAAEIDEGPEVHELPHHAVADLAGAERFEEFSPRLFPLALQHGPAAKTRFRRSGSASVMTQVSR